MVSVLANSAVVSGYLQCVLDKARLMYQEKAYLHWFEKYGCGKETFEEAFQTLDKMLDNYKDL